jgi:hypothetical protein
MGTALTALQDGVAQAPKELQLWALCAQDMHLGAGAWLTDTPAVDPSAGCSMDASA